MRGITVTVGARSRHSQAMRFGVLLVASLALLCGMSRPARADANRVKGIVGGAMLGAEVVLLTESALRLQPRWVYWAGGAGGAALGTYIGYRIGGGSSNKPPAFMLAGGIALVIPTIMGVLTATQYAPPESFRPDDEDSDGGSDDEDRDPDDGAHLELPSVGLAQAFSREELSQHRVRQATELHLSLLRGVF